MIEDAYIVPVSISYDKLVDGNFVKEQMVDVAYFCAEINCQCSFYLNSMSVYRFLIEYSFRTSVVRKSLETGCCLHIVHITVIVLCDTDD